MGSSTVYAIVRGQFPPRLETLAALMEIVEALSGEPVSLTDVLEYDKFAPTVKPTPFSVSKGNRHKDS